MCPKLRRARAEAEPAPSPHSQSPDISSEDRQRLLDELRTLNEQLVITSVHQQELAEKSERTASQLNALLDSVAEGVIVVDADGRLTVANPPARAILGLPPTGGLSRVHDWNKLNFRYLDGRLLPYEEGPLSRALRGERFTDCEVLLVLPAGVRRRIAAAGSAVRNASGQVVLAIVVFRDVTEVRELEQLKEDYVSLISHDLRAPLTVILGQAWMLGHLSGPLTAEEAKAYAMPIDRNVRRMQRMIEDLLLTTRLETGRLVLAKEPVDLAEVVRAVVEDEIEPEGQGRIHVDVAIPLPLVIADRERIERVIANLLSNALKFSPKNSSVDVKIGKRGGDVVVAVTDHGAGIAPEYLEHVFEKYYRGMVDQHRVGHGLGLYISRLIVEASGGRVWAESEVGKGSTFSFSLPVQ